MVLISQKKSIGGSIAKSGELHGKRVISKKGNYLGEVEDLIINKKQMKLEGITLEKGLFSNDDVIGTDHIKEISDTTLMVDFDFEDHINDMKVFSSDHKFVGRVKRVKQNLDNGGEYHLIIEKGLTQLDIKAKKDDIERIGEQIILRKSIVDLGDDAE